MYNVKKITFMLNMTFLVLLLHRILILYHACVLNSLYQFMRKIPIPSSLKNQGVDW